MIKSATILAFLGTFLALFLAQTPISAQVSGNLLQNPGFESNLSNWFCQGARSGTCTIESNPQYKFSGNNSVKITNIGGGSWGWQLFQGGISATSGQSFCISGYVKKRSGMDTVSLAIQEDGTPYKDIHTLAGFNTTNWQLVRKTLTVPSGWKSPIRVLLRVHEERKEAWFDEISLTNGACTSTPVAGAGTSAASVLTGPPPGPPPSWPSEQQAPQITISPPPGTQINSGSTITLTCSDSLAGDSGCLAISYQIDSGTPQIRANPSCTTGCTGTFNTNVSPIPTTSFNLTYYAIDRAGNTSPQQTPAFFPFQSSSAGPWIKTTGGNVHSNTKIDINGGP